MLLCSRFLGSQAVPLDVRSLFSPFSVCSLLFWASYSRWLPGGGAAGSLSLESLPTVDDDSPDGGQAAEPIHEAKVVKSTSTSHEAKERSGAVGVTKRRADSNDQVSSSVPVGSLAGGRRLSSTVAIA